MAHSAKLTFSDGLLWIREAFKVVKDYPLVYVGMVLFSSLVTGLLVSIPFIGELLTSLWQPFSSLLLAWGARNALAARLPVYDPLFQSLSEAPIRNRLLNLGVWHCVIVTLYSLLASALLPDVPVEPTLADMTELSVQMTLGFVPIMVMMMFAPILVVDRAQSSGKALLSSLLGVVLEWRAVGSAFVLFATLAGVAAGAFYGIWVLTARSTLALLIFAPVLVTLLAAIGQALVWPMYRDIFGEAGGFKVRAFNRR